MWPAFVALTLVDAVILDALPPVRLGVDEDGMTFPFALIIATFGNLFLIGAVAPWLARRLVARPAPADEAPPAVRFEGLRDRTATVLLALGVAGIVAAGLGSRPVTVQVTREREQNADAVRAYVLHTGDRELIDNLETANTRSFSDTYFRTCVARNDRRRYVCVFVDTEREPPRVVLDRSQEPNAPEP
jgi:hypothetical protein